MERRDPAFETNMAEVLCVYREVAVLRAAEAGAGKVVIISYDESRASRSATPHPTGRRSPDAAYPTKDAAFRGQFDTAILAGRCRRDRGRGPG